MCFNLRAAKFLLNIVIALIHRGVRGSTIWCAVMASAPKRSARSRSAEVGRNRRRRYTKSHRDKNNTFPSTEKKDEILTQNYTTLSLEKLRSLNKKQPDEIVQSLASSTWFGDFRTCIKKEKVIPQDLFEVLLEIFSKGSESICRDDLNKIYCELPDSLFLLKHIPHHLTIIATTSPQKGALVLSNAIRVLTVLVRKIPGCYEILPMNVLKRVLQKYQLSATAIDERIFNDYNHLVEIHEDLSKPKQRNVDVQSTKRPGEKIYCNRLSSRKRNEKFTQNK